MHVHETSLSDMEMTKLMVSYFIFMVCAFNFFVDKACLKDVQKKW